MGGWSPRLSRRRMPRWGREGDDENNDEDDGHEKKKPICLRSGGYGTNTRLVRSIWSGVLLFFRHG